VVRTHPWKSLGIALSFAYLCCLRIWKVLLTYSPADAYFMTVLFRGRPVLR
jgi:hypothetical protein